MVAAKFDICEFVGRDKKHLVQLCLPYEKLKPGELKYPLLVSEKFDGVFAFALVMDGECLIFSRTGEEYTSLEHLKAPLMTLYKDLECEVIIFEAYAEGVPQPTISGWCRDTKKQHTEVEAYIHDAMTIEEFIAADTPKIYMPETYYVRYGFLKLHFDGYPYLHLIPQFHVECETALMALAESVWARGGEGVVARTEFGGYYPGKRNAYMVKLKKGVSFDLKVTGVEEGTGKYSGCTGKLICQDLTGKTIKVGSGLSDEQRKAWWSNSEEIIGKIVQVDAMAVSTKGVLREPRFKGIRYDKKEADFIV